jgi:hypothetical protein
VQATLLALGGGSNSTLTNEGEGAANAMGGMNLVVPGSPLVSSVVTAILDAGYGAAFDWASVVNTVQVGVRVWSHIFGGGGGGGLKGVLCCMPGDGAASHASQSLLEVPLCW